MKQPFKLPLYLLVPTVFLLLLISGFQKSGYNPRLLVRVENVVIDRNTPARFLLTFQGGEKLNLEFIPYLNFKGNVSLIVKNQANPVETPNIIALSNSALPLHIEQAGEYLFEFSTLSKDKLPFSFILTETNSVTAQRKPGVALKADRLFVEKASAVYGRPRIVVPVLQGDKISVSSSDANQAPMISGKYAQQGIPFNLGKPPIEFIVSFEGVATFELWSDKSDPRFFNLLNRNEGVDLNHLMVSVAPPPPPITTVPASEVVSGADMVAKDTTAAAKDPTLALMEMIAKMMAEDSTPQLKRLRQDSIVFDLAPSMDVQTGSSASCKCEELNRLSLGDTPTDFWDYFIGNERTNALLGPADNTSLFAVEDQMKDLLGVYGKKVDKLTDKTFNLNKDFYASFGSTPQQKAYIYSSEWFEYAIVSGPAAKDSFELNLPYTRIGTLGSKRTVYDLGNYPYKEGLFVCVRNHNKLVPLRIYFRFHSFGHVTPQQL